MHLYCRSRYMVSMVTHVQQHPEQQQQQEEEEEEEQEGM
jgi:hypothetical protein